MGKCEKLTEYMSNNLSICRITFAEHLWCASMQLCVVIKFRLGIVVFHVNLLTDGKTSGEA